MPRQVVRCPECFAWSKRPAVVAEALHCPRCRNVVCWPDRWAEGPSVLNETPTMNAPALPATNGPRPPASTAQTRESVRAGLLARLAVALWCVLWAGVAWVGWLDGAACVLLGVAGVVMMGRRRM
jgi:hypothetical protein